MEEIKNWVVQLDDLREAPFTGQLRHGVLKCKSKRMIVIIIVIVLN